MPLATKHRRTIKSRVLRFAYIGYNGENVSTPLQAIARTLYAFVDWFIPERLQADASIVQSVRMFLFSHIFGPFLGHTISIYVLFVQGRPDFAWWVFFGAITLFWPYSFILRATGLYVPLALISIQNLMFCILWGCYHYGGISSPILPWLITVPLLAFFYLPTRKTRIIVSLQILGNLAGFFLIYSSQGFPETIPLGKLVGLGIVSTLCASVYVSMMALYYASIVSSQSELEQEIGRHRVTERQLREAIEQVERATQAKSIFLAKMSHELRNPLNAIIGYSEMLLEESEADDQKRGDLTSIKDAGHGLLELVNDLLDLSKLEAGKMEVYLKPVSLDAFATEIEVAWKERVVQSGNQFIFSAVSGLGTVVVDAVKLRQAVDNVIVNAIKHTSSGEITVTVSKESGLIAIAVRDTGSGMNSRQVAKVFETFGSQEGETSTSYADDPGLGLPLSRRLCQLMGGDIAAESDPGHGSCFTIRIPYYEATNADDDERGATLVEEPAERNVDKGAILIIDDDTLAVDLVARILTREGFAPIVASNLVDGLARARDIKPPVILLNIGMSVSDDVLRQIREDPELHSCRVILVTDNDDLTKGLALDADAHLFKPIGRDLLVRAIEQVRFEAPVVPDDACFLPLESSHGLLKVRA